MRVTTTGTTPLWLLAIILLGSALATGRGQNERPAALFEDGIVSRQRVDQARSALDAAQARFDALETQAREQAVQLRVYHITAPAGGEVGDIPVLPLVFASGAGSRARASRAADRVAEGRSWTT